MTNTKRIAPVLAILILTGGFVFSQGNLGSQLSDLMALKSKAADADTRVRVDALHKAWAIGLASAYPEVKLSALDVMLEPAGSASDHIRMPAVYAIAEIANSTTNTQVKLKALAALREPLDAGQVPIRDAAIDAVNLITRSANRREIALAAVKALGPPVKSGNNGVRIPAINAIVRAVEGSQNDSACDAAIDLLVAPMDSAALIGGMEVRMMAVAAVQKIGVEALGIGTKAKAMGLLQSYAARGDWEEEAKKRAQEGARIIQGSIKE